MDSAIQPENEGDFTALNRGDPKMQRTLCDYFNELGKWKVWRSILLGQFLSLLLCGTGISSQFLQMTYKIQVPTAQSFLNYALLCLVFTTCLACRGGDNSLFKVIRARGWKYLFLAVVDVEANFLLVKAYQYTTLTSIQLLDCFTIPTVLALSWLCLKVRYKLLHILGVGVALIGIGCLVWADIRDTRIDTTANILLGDMLCLLGAALYGVSNVAEEFVVKTFDVVEFLGMLGLFGAIVNGVQLVLLERHELATIHWDRWQEVALLVGFGSCLFCLYVTMPAVMRLSSATAVNLSILSADFYSLLAGVYIFHFQFHWLYLASFGCVVGGVVLYHIKPTPILGGAEPLQGETVELTNQSTASYTPTTNQSALSFATPTSATAEETAMYMWTTLPRVGTISHSVSVHCVDSGLDYSGRRNGTLPLRRDYRTPC